mmetsp:Transcript_15960/g.32712  ORF Transcript_15960/g.32712 Transcript_15960/m.32712 type:complete len:204 (-) Transcript_15960:188-799(-)
MSSSRSPRRTGPPKRCRSATSLPRFASKLPATAPRTSRPPSRSFVTFATFTTTKSPTRGSSTRRFMFPTNSFTVSSGPAEQRSSTFVATTRLMFTCPRRSRGAPPRTLSASESRTTSKRPSRTSSFSWTGIPSYGNKNTATMPLVTIRSGGDGGSDSRDTDNDSDNDSDKDHDHDKNYVVCQFFLVTRRMVWRCVFFQNTIRC